MKKIVSKNRKTFEESMIKQFVHNYNLKNAKIKANCDQKWLLFQKRMIHAKIKKWKNDCWNKKELKNRRLSYSFFINFKHELSKKSCASFQFEKESWSYLKSSNTAWIVFTNFVCYTSSFLSDIGILPQIL